MTSSNDKPSAVAPNTARTMADHWNERADRFQRSPSHLRLREMWDAVFAKASGLGNGIAIDLGCGTGACALSMAKLGYQVTAVDGSGGMLAHARADASILGLDVEFLEADMDSLSFADGIADVVSIRNVLWTLELPEQAIRLARRLLQPNGKLFLSDAVWRVSEDSEIEFGHRLPNFRGVSKDEAMEWLVGAGFATVQSWQHLFQSHPYGPKYDALDESDMIEFFVLTATASADQHS